MLSVEHTYVQKNVAAIDSKFIKALRDPVTIKITREIPQILTYLFNAYVHVTPSEL